MDTLHVFLFLFLREKIQHFSAYVWIIIRDKNMGEVGREKEKKLRKTEIVI